MPSGPGIICNALIKEIAAKIPPPVTPFLLTSETHVSRIAEHQQQVHINTIQMVDAVDVDQYDEIRAVLPGIKLVQVIHVTNEKSIEDAIRVSKQVDALLLDSGNPNRTIKNWVEREESTIGNGVKPSERKFRFLCFWQVV